VFTSFLHWSLSWARSIQSIPTEFENPIPVLCLHARVALSWCTVPLTSSVIFKNTFSHANQNKEKQQTSVLRLLRWSLFRTNLLSSDILSPWRRLPTFRRNMLPNPEYGDTSLWNISVYKTIQPITVAVRCKAWTVFARSNAGIAGSNPTQSMDVCLRLFCACVGSSPVTGWSPVQGVLPTVYLRNWSETKRFTVHQSGSNRKERETRLYGVRRPESKATDIMLSDVWKPDVGLLVEAKGWSQVGTQLCFATHTQYNDKASLRIRRPHICFYRWAGLMSITQ
jgi:hypothetical protein